MNSTKAVTCSSPVPCSATVLHAVQAGAGGKASCRGGTEEVALRQLDIPGYAAVKAHPEREKMAIIPT